VLLTRDKPYIGGPTCNIPLDIIQRADPIESLARNLGFVRGPDVMKVTPPMCPAGSFAEAALPVRSRLI
jgi:hypothetical protein